MKPLLLTLLLFAAGCHQRLVPAKPKTAEHVSTKLLAGKTFSVYSFGGDSDTETTYYLVATDGTVAKVDMIQWGMHDKGDNYETDKWMEWSE